MSIKKLPLALAATYLSTAALSLGATVYSESFDIPPFTAGTDVAGQQGWTGSEYIDVSSTGLTNAGMLGTSGGSLVYNAAAYSDHPVVTSATIGTDSNSGPGEYWFAALMSMTDDSGGDFSYINMAFDSAPSSGFYFGLVDGEFRVGISTNTTSTTGFSGTQYTDGTTLLVVGRMTVTSTASATNETLDFWLNPTDATSAETLTITAQATVQRTDLSIINSNWGAVSVRADIQASPGLAIYQDEYRVGTSLSDLNLASIPEPSSYGMLLGLAGLISVLWRRR